MSDSQEKMLEELGRRLGQVYGALAAACESLPVLPISIPLDGRVSNLEAVPAVRRAAELAEEVPMPEDQQAQLFTASTMWLAAMDLYALLVRTEYIEARAQGCIGCIIVAEDALIFLMEWLADLKD
ncbi:hypothetical protein [Streptomyces thermolilacinus]|uniref:hypothetical protein n=1 Tax=Streptomyces thermolilacinus TaxID=285540 RepID=UPI0033DF0832